jgi:hypothetical protein
LTATAAADRVCPGFPAPRTRDRRRGHVYVDARPPGASLGPNVTVRRFDEDTTWIDTTLSWSDRSRRPTQRQRPEDRHFAGCHRTAHEGRDTVSSVCLDTRFSARCWAWS